MHATIRRYDGVDQNRITELTGKVNETLVPKLRTLPGFKGYYLIEAGDDGAIFSLGSYSTARSYFAIVRALGSRHSRLV